jgi:hypothetical protein
MACGQVPFNVLARICGRKRLGVDGALGGLDLFVEFFPVGKDTVEHGLFVHVHAIVNSSQPLSWEGAQLIYSMFCDQRSKVGISLFPDLEISLIRTKEEFQGWLRYTLKPMKFDEFYFKGAAACDDRPGAFNDEFDQVVFNGAHLAYGGVKSPRYYGNMQQRRNTKKDFIGVWQYPPVLNQREFKRIGDALKNGRAVTAEEAEKYDEHLLYRQQQAEQRRARKARREREKQSRRRGGRNQDHRAAVHTDAGAEAAARSRAREVEL